MGCEEIKIVGCGEIYGMWAVENVEREIRNVGCGEIEGMWYVEIVETYKECGLWKPWREIRNVGCGDSGER